MSSYPASTTPIGAARLEAAENRADKPDELAAAVHATSTPANVWRELERGAGAGNGPLAVSNAILSAALRLFPEATSGALYLFQSERLARLISLWSDGRPDGPAGAPAAGSVAATVALSGQPEILPDFAAGHNDVLTLAALPLKSAGRLVGVINLTFHSGYQFGPDEQLLLERLNQEAGVAIDSAWLFEITRRQVQELTVLHLVAVAAAEAIDEDQLIARATQIIGAELFPDNFGILLVDPGTGGLRLHPSYQGVDDNSLTLTIPRGEGLTGAAVALGQPIRRADVRVDSRFVDIGPVTLSELCVPLKVGERVIGVVNAESARADAFTESDERLVITLAGQLAIAIDRLRVAAAEKREAQRAAESRGVLYQASQAINASLEAEQVYASTHRAVEQLMACEAFIIALLDDAEQKTELVYAVDRGQRLQSQQSEWRNGLTGYVLTTGRPLRQDRLDPSDPYQALHFGGQEHVQSLVAVPMRLRGKVFGMLSAQAYRPGAFDEGDEQILSLLANQVAVAIEHARLFEAEREQRQLAVVLRETGAILSASLELNDVLDRLLEQVERLVPYNTGTIVLIDGRQGRLARWRGYERYGAAVVEQIQGMTLDLDSTPTLRTLVETGQPLIIPDVAQFPGWLNLAASPHIRSWIGAPMIAQGEAIAAFALDQITTDFFQPRHARSLALFAGQAALAVRNALLFEAQRQRVSALTALHEVGLDLSQHLDLPVLLRMITEHAIRLVKGGAGGIYLRQEDGALEAAISHNYRRDYTGLRLQSGEGVAGQVVATGQPIVAGDYSLFPRRAAAYDEELIRSAIGVPVRAQGQIVGVLVVTHELPNVFRAHDAEIVTLFSDQAAVAIVNARLYAEVRANALELRRLFAASQEMAASRAPQLVLEALAKHLTEGLEVTSAYIVEVDLKESTIGVLAEYWSAAAPETERITVHGTPFPLADYPHAERSALEQSVVQFRLADEVLSDSERVFLTIYGVQSELIVPVLARGQTLGLATIWESRRQRIFSLAEIRLAQTLARQAGDVIENARLFAALEDEKRRLELLYNLSQSLTATLDLAEVAGRALELVRGAFGADGGAIFAPEDGGRELTLLSAGGGATPGDSDPAGLATDMARAAAQAADTRTIVRTQAPPINPAGGAGQSVFTARLSLVAVPLQIGDSLVAVCVLASRQRVFAGGATQPMLLAVAAPMALALQNAQLFEGEARRAHHLEALNEITRAAVGALDFPSLLQTMAARLNDLLSADVCYLTLWDETRRTPIPAAASPPRVEISPLVMPPEGAISITETVLAARKALVAEDVTAAPWLIQPAVAGLLSARSVIALPLITSNRRLGAAIVEFQNPHHFTSQEIARAEQAGRQIALAIARAELFEETRRRADEVTAAAEVLRALNAVPDVGQAFPVILRGLRAISRCERVRLTVFDQDGGLFRLVADDAGVNESGGEAYPIDDLAAAADVLAGREHLAADLALEINYPVEARLYAGGMRSSVTLPLRATNQILGALRLGWSQPSGYRAVNVASLTQIADAIALALEKSRLLAETRRRADELATLVSLSTALRAASTSNDVLPIFLRQACEVTGAVVSTVFIVDAETGELVMRGSFPPRPDLVGLKQHAGVGIAGRVAQTGDIYVARDLLTDPLVQLGSPAEAEYLSPVRSSLTVPLRAHEGVVGVLHVGRDQPHDFGAEEIHLLTAIAEIAGSALQRANLLETLEQRVDERTRALAEANIQLKELDRLKDQFISNVSHELRTPLTNIKLHLSLLERRGMDGLDRYLPTIQRETERLRRLIEDLLDLSRLQAQIAAPRRQLQRIDHLMAEVIALYATRAEARGLSLNQLSAMPLIEAPVDRAQMLQVFTNLIGNAIAYTPSGGSVEVSTKIAAEAELAGVQISFKNWPASIAPGELPHLFDRFFRGKTALESGEVGTGLGLAISKDIVELHGGRIWVESSPELVTTVGIWLPLLE